MSATGPNPDPARCHCVSWAYDHRRSVIWRSLDLGTGAPVPLGHHPACEHYEAPPADCFLVQGLGELLPAEYPAALRALALAYARVVRAARNGEFE